MSTEVLNNLLIYLQETLTLENRKWLAERLVEPIPDVFRPLTMEEIDRRIDQAEADLAAGRVISNDEMIAFMNELLEDAKTRSV